MNPWFFDGLVILAYFALIMGIGLSQRSKSGTMEGFALGDRQIAWWAVLASILAAEISAGTFFGTPGEGYALKNYTYVQLILGYLLARVIVSAVFIPAYYRHNVVSIYEFLGTRFGPGTRRMASAVFLVTRVLASGARLWVPTILFVLLWKLANPGVHLSTAAELGLYAVSIIGITILTTIYTTLGGIRAVIWTDVIQIVVLFGALGFSVWFLLGHVSGGWAGAQELLRGDPQAFKVIDWGVDPSRTFGQNLKHVLESEYTMWAALLGSTFVTLATHGTDQDMVQRMLTAKNKQQSGFATILSGLIDIPVVLMVLTIGILLWAYYTQAPDVDLPRTPEGKIINSQVFPWFILTQMPAGLRGLVIAGVLATTMGSLSTAMNSLATSYVRDFHFRWFGEPADDQGRVRALRIGTGLFAFFLILVALITAYVVTSHPELRIIPIILGIFGYTYGSLLGVFLVALFTKGRGNDFGNTIAMIAGFLVVAYLSGLDKDIMHNFGGGALWRPEGFPIVEFPWRILFGTLTTFSIAVAFRTSGTRMDEHEAKGLESGQ